MAFSESDNVDRLIIELGYGVTNRACMMS